MFTSLSLSLLLILGLLALPLLWFIYIMRTGKNGAPFVPMEPVIIERALNLANIKEGEVFYELGSGDGRIVIAAALRGANANGIEIDKLRYLYSSMWIKLLRLNNASILNDNLFNVNLSDANIVLTYLLEETNQKLEEKLQKELKKGTRVIGVGFPFPGWNPVKVDPYGPVYGPIHLYVM